MSCNVCGEPLHMGCCNPARPERSHLNLTMARELGFAEEEIASWGDGADIPPMALTDRHIAALERAIRAEGYSILVDPSTGHVLLTRAAPVGCPKCKDGGWVCENHSDEVAHECRHCGGAGMPCTCDEGQRAKGAELDIWPICGPVGSPEGCGRCERCKLEVRAAEEAAKRGEQPFWKV